MIHMTLKQLRYFDALARHGHFGRAAEACAISQPALSMQIRELEDAMGATLVDRSARQVQLTAFGAQAVMRTRDILRAIDELADLARASHDQLVGRLRLGVIPTVAPYLLPQVIGDLADTHPELELHVRETKTPRLVDELAGGRLDAAIVALPLSEPALTEVPLLSEDFVLVRHGSEAETPVPSVQNLPKKRLLLLEEGHCFRDQALSFCNMPAIRPRDMLDASSLSTLVQMVNAGMGITLIPEMAIDVETRSTAVAVDRFGDPTPSRTLGMVWRKTSPLASQLTEISRQVRDSAERTRKGSVLTRQQPAIS